VLSRFASIPSGAGDMVFGSKHTPQYLELVIWCPALTPQGGRKEGGRKKEGGRRCTFVEI